MPRKPPPFPTRWHAEFAERMKMYRGLKGVAAVRRKGTKGPLVFMTYATAKMFEDAGGWEIVEVANSFSELREKLGETTAGGD